MDTATVYDTVVVYDTIAVYDTFYIDTALQIVPIFVFVEIPIYIQVYDTIPVYDTMIVYDSIQLYVIDTVTFPFPDTIVVYDTTFITIPDTTFITYYDTISVTDTLIIDVIITGTDNQDISTQIKVYPNPSNDVVFIDFQDFAVLENYRMKIIGLDGREITHELINMGQYRYEISQFGAKGLYILQLFDEQNELVTTRKILLQ